MNTGNCYNHTMATHTFSPYRLLLVGAVFITSWGKTWGSLLQWGDCSFRRRPGSSSSLSFEDVVDAVQRRGLDDDDAALLGSFPGQSSRPASSSSSSIVLLVNRVKMWPPWPLSLLQRDEDDDNDESTSSKRKGDDDSQVVTARNTYPSAAAVALSWFTHRARIGVRQIQEVGSSLWFHFPPSLPPLLLIASWPRKISGGVGDVASRTMIPLFSDPFVRTLVLSGLGVAVLSWAHQELNRKRKLTPLPLALPYQLSVSKVFLPPFLPELVPAPEIEALQQTTTATLSSSSTSLKSESEEDDDDDPEDPSQIFSLLNPRLRKHLSDIYENTPLIGGGNNKNPLRRRGLFKEWKRKREVQKREAAKIRRAIIFDELVALQAIKRKSATSRKNNSAKSENEGELLGDEVPPLGYALVTGASQGIGRALAVELARWEIPLILVARDLDRLTSLAYDLEACYGVRCCVLKADLSQADAAERIHEATTKAGLTVDILVNNAGIAYEGLSINMEPSLIERMIMINTMSFAKLSTLYGLDMINRGRGRILMVSSMAGLCSASPNTALYGATKAFEKSLSFSMSKELEPYGVGVTCLMPGPVVNTQFRLRSGTSKALCWLLPYYPRPADSVAHLGIVSLLDGDTQVLPGWQNRAFAQLFRPLLPQRVETMCVQAAWSPFRLPSWKNIIGRQDPPPLPPKVDQGGLVNTTPPESVHLDLKPRYSFQMPPRLLQLEETPVDTPPTTPVEVNEPLPELEVSEDPPPAPVDQVSTNMKYNATERLPKPADSAIIQSPSVGDETKGTPVVETIQGGHDSTGDNEMDTSEESLPATIKPSAPKVEESPALAPAAPSPATTVNTNVTLNAPKDEGGRLGKEGTTKETTKSEPVGTRRRSQAPPDHQSQFEEDDDSTSDFFLSPRLGPIDLLHERHEYSLPRSSTTKAEPKWTVRT